MPSSTQNQIANLRTKGQRWVGKNKQTSLRPMRHPRRRIIDIALPDADVRDEQHLDGTITLVPHVVSDTFPTVAGHIVCGGPSAPVVVGSRVHINNNPEVELVVMSFTDTHRRHVELFPQRGHPVQRPWSALHRV